MPSQNLRNVVVLFLAVVTLAAAQTKDCKSLAETKLPHVSISTAEEISSGKLTTPTGRALDQLPSFCRVAGVIEPTADSYIRFEVWLPLTAWNNKYLGVGNGGFAGSIDYNSMAGDLRRGYTTAATDTGHEAEAEDASWAFHHPEKIIDFGYRALHETTGIAKDLIQAFYGSKPRYSYFDSCSDGGREALMEAQRFPDDFDGILAGAPANNWTNMLAAGIGVIQKTVGNPTGYISSIKLPAIGTAVRAACDAQDGVKDGFINDPPRCHFDPAVLRCHGVESRTCLTEPQIESLKIFYGLGVKPGDTSFLGFAPGGEDGPNSWSSWVIGPAPGGSSSTFYLENFFRYMVYNNPSWNALTASADEARHTAAEKVGHDLNAMDADLTRFSAHGGKLILYHGWNDPAISPKSTINYYNSVVAKMGTPATQNLARLYMVPGMQHCIGGPGPNWFGQLGTVTAGASQHGIYDALEAWVEQGTAPAAITATKFVQDNPTKGVAMTRPLCAYPMVAKYNGTGDTKKAESFSCSAPVEK